ncbi:MAG: energy transducer TonB, partial [Pseudomonadota bacterium]
MRLAYEDIILDEGMSGSFWLFVLTSLILHLAVFYFAVKILPDLGSKYKPLPPIYTVNLVTLPGSPPPGPAAAPAEKPKAAEAIAPPAAKPAVPIAPPPAPPKPEPAELIPIGPVKPEETPAPELKKTTKPPPEPEVKPEPKPAPKPEVEPKVDPNRQLQAALARTRARTEGRKDEEHLREAMAKIKAQQGGEGADRTDGGAGIPGVRGRGPVSELDSRMRDYYVVLYNIISAKWVMPPPAMMGNKKDLEAIYVIRIDPSGKIAKAWFERKSGVALFDQSAIKAVEKSDPLPRLPEVFKDASIEVGLRFTPRGVE